MPELVRDLIGAMVNDVLAETRGAAPAGMASAEEVRAAGRPLAGFSAAMAAEERALKAFLHARMYEAPPVQAVRAEAQRDPRRPVRGLSRRSRAGCPKNGGPPSADPTDVARAIGDFIAGMTDRYAMRRYAELVGPGGLPEGLDA